MPVHIFYTFINCLKYFTLIKFIYILNNYKLVKYTGHNYQMVPYILPNYKSDTYFLYNVKQVTYKKIKITNLTVISNLIAKRYETGFKLFGFQATGTVFVKMIKRHTEFIHLILADALGIPCQNLSHKWKICHSLH